MSNIDPELYDAMDPKLQQVYKEMSPLMRRLFNIGTYYSIAMILAVLVMACLGCLGAISFLFVK